MKLKLIAPLLLLLAISFSACKKNDPGPNEVFIDGMAFSPSSITVQTGTTITWTNKESTTHTVVSDGSAFASGELKKKDTFSFTFTTAGTFPYHCGFHSSMKGTVIVQ